MESQSTTSLAEQLLRAQLIQWQNLKAELETRPDPDQPTRNDIAYSESKIIELSNELALF